MKISPLAFILMFLTTISNIRAEDSPILIKDGAKIAFLGDSITAQGAGGPGGYVRLIVDGLAREGIKVTPIPAGVSGNTSKDMLARIDTDVIDKQPDWMTLSCGVNDVWHGANGVDLETYKKNITAIVDRAQAKGIKIVILTSTPIGEDDNDFNKKLAAYNDFLRQLAKERSLPLADLNADFHAALGDGPRPSSSRELTVDGVHMNPDGNILMAKGCLRALGLPADDLAKIETAWDGQSGLAPLPVILTGPAANAAISLNQYHALQKSALKNKTDVIHIATDLWLKSLGEVLQKHDKGLILDAEKIRRETTEILLQKLDALAKE